MSSLPFPVLVRRSHNSSDRGPDAVRRQLVVRVLTDLGNADADQRTMVSQPYSNGLNSTEGELDYGRCIRSRGSSNGRLAGATGGF